MTWYNGRWYDSLSVYHIMLLCVKSYYHSISSYNVYIVSLSNVSYYVKWIVVELVKYYIISQIHCVLLHAYHTAAISHASKDLSSISPTFWPECWPENHTAVWRSSPSQMLAPSACRGNKQNVRTLGPPGKASYAAACHDPKACIGCSGCNWKVPPQWAPCSRS